MSKKSLIFVCKIHFLPKVLYIACPLLIVDGKVRANSDLMSARKAWNKEVYTSHVL